MADQTTRCSSKLESARAQRLVKSMKQGTKFKDRRPLWFQSSEPQGSMALMGRIFSREPDSTVIEVCPIEWAAALQSRRRRRITFGNL
jgi:hypothetical protein